jgi:hypothetical protein
VVVRSRASVAVGLVSAAALLASLALPSGLVASVAAWNDSEFDHARVGVLDCDTAGTYASRGEGQFLGGGVLGIPLDTIADLNAVTVINNGTGAVPQPASATSVGPDGFANPLKVDALNDLVQLDLTNLLVLPLETDVGAIKEYARASATGDSAGATGLISESGAIAVDTVPQTESDWATVKLSNLVDEVTDTAISDLVADIADVDLSVGAVASSAVYDGCNADFSGDVAANLTREYLVAGLDSTATTPLVGDLVTTVEGALTSLEGLVGGLSENEGLIDDVTESITDLLDPVLGILGLGSLTVDVSATVNFSAVEALLDDTLSDSVGLVSVSLADGTVTIDLATLLGGPDGLNNLAPNTELVVNDAALTKVTTALGQVLDDWTTQVIAAVNNALDLIVVDISVKVVLRVEAIGLNVATITAAATDVSLADLRTGKVGMEATVSDVVTGGTLGLVLNGVTCRVLQLCELTPALVGTIAGLVEGMLESPVNGAGVIVGTAVFDLLAPVVTTLGTTLTGAITPLITTIASLYEVLFGNTDEGLSGVLSLGVNLQNAPETGGLPAPADWTTGDDAIPAGQYDVAALRVGVLDGLGASTNINLDLARSSVGANTLVP